ncbi:RNA polymerase recycling motor ATPase HelR [Paramicrobacterium agarici]|uniref:RNA polymerase recycling motor ATPase HelR n=1 Tax=Paramicrobacterium agarici TaxID=630514 RepID=UPI001168FFE4|nr:DNA helicase IV [Microbacterium agarici]
MPRVTMPIFDLSPHHDAHARPELVADDEAHLAAVADALDREIADLTRRRDDLRKATAGGGQKALDRDLEIHRLSSRLRVLSRFGLDVCLGRIVPEGEQDPLYIGRLNVTDADGEILLIDWRAPAAEPYFGATHAHPMGLASRRRYRWTRGRITDYWDEAFTPDAVADSSALDDQSAFIASLGATRSSRMRDVLGTIQADQDAIIRAGSRGALVVDGGPGTGKTVVALHRAAYLLYSHPRIGRGAGGVLFVGPSSPYLAYVSDVLPSLGEDGAQVCTIADMVPEAAGGVAAYDPAAAVKASPEFNDVIDRAVAYHERPPRGDVHLETEWGLVTISAQDWKAAFDAPTPGTAHNDAREEVWSELMDIVVDAYAGDIPEQGLRRSLRAHSELLSTFSDAWPLLDPAGVVADLWSVPAYLRQCAPQLSESDVETLQREHPREWTRADLPILDAARLRTGDPAEVRVRRQREVALRRQQETMGDVIEKLLDSRDLDDGEGVLPMLQVDDTHNSLIDESQLPHLTPDALAGPFGHVIVDEAQELTDAEWLMLLRRCPSRSFTIVGDRAQARHGFTESWGERLARIGLTTVEQARLRINYRTPSEIMDAAEPVIRSVFPDANVPTSVRDSGIPVVSGEYAELDSILNTWLDAHAEGVACVIGDPSRADTARVRSLSAASSKGLEFDLVVLVEQSESDASIEATVDRYVAMTRATQKLVVLRR